MMTTLIDIAACGVVAGCIGSLIAPKKALELTVNAARDDDWEIYGKIKRALRKNPRVLKIDLIGLGRIHPTVLLGIHDLLIKKNASTRIEVGVRTNLADGMLIFLIHAQKLEIREGAWFQVASAEDLVKPFTDDDDDDVDWKKPSIINTVYEEPLVTDYRKVTTILNEYLPLKEFSKKRLPLEPTLKEFGLIKSHAEEMELNRLFSETS